MNSFGWDGNMMAVYQPCVWSSNCNGFTTQPEMSSSSIESAIGTMDPTEDFFAGSENLFGFGAGSSGMINQSCSNSDAYRANQMLEQLIPALDCINGDPNLVSSHRQEAIRLAADSVLAKSGAGAGAIWTEAMTADLSGEGMIPASFDEPPPVMGSCDLEQHNQLKISDADSMESLECLLSGTTTSNHTDLSMEDDGKTLWNPSSSSADSGTKFINSDASMRHSLKRTSQVEGARHHPYYNILHSSPATAAGTQFKLISDAHSKPTKRQKREHISFGGSPSAATSSGEPDVEAIAQMKEMIYRAAAFRPVNFAEEETTEKPKRKNVRISSDPQTVAARQRRERISDRIRVLQKLVPGGSKMDTASMLDEAASYLKFLKSQVLALEKLGHKLDSMATTTSSPLLTFPSNLHHSFIPTHLPHHKSMM